LEFVPPPTYVLGTKIDFTQAGSRVYLSGVWHGPEAEWQWTGRQATIGFQLQPVQPLRLRMMVTAFGKQRIVVRFNGREIQTLDRSGDKLELAEIDLPPDAVMESNTLQLTMPDAKSPQSVGAGDDDRILGVGMAWLEFQPLS
jgi:hypothetical protein